MKNNSLLEIANQLNKAQNVAIFCHARPDGDALGSGVGLCLALKSRGKNAFIICEETPPAKFGFLSGIETVYTILPMPIDKFDLLVAVDCADVSRLGAFAYDFLKYKGTTVNIDHHISNNSYAKFNYVVDCTATCELMPEILEAANIEITQDVANLFMLGLITDSGNFAHKDVTEKTFAVASKLRGAGADVNAINYNMYSRQPVQRALLYAKVISKMRFELDGKLAFLIISADDMSSTGAERSMTEGFVDFPLTIEDVQVSIALLETGKRQYKASLRGKNTDVNAVASQFGGGGHKLASGCMIFGDLEEVIDRLKYAVYQNL